MVTVRRTGRKRDLDTYWASLPTAEFLENVHIRIKDFYDDIYNNGLYTAIDTSYRYYYGGSGSAGVGNSNSAVGIFGNITLGKGGKQGEKSLLKLNHFRNVLQHTLQLSTSDKPAYSCKAINSDYESQTQTILANGLLDYYIREKNLLQVTRDSAELSIVTTEGWVHMPWDVSAGKEVSKDPMGTPIMEGDTAFTVHPMIDVVRDIGIQAGEDAWRCIRVKKNKWDLIAQRPDLEQQIKDNATSLSDYENLDSFYFSLNRLTFDQDTDQCWVWIFYHKPTPALKEGRLVEFMGDVALYDGPMPYKRIPLIKMIPSKIMNTPYAYTPAFDLLPAQHGLDIISSILLTNNVATGGQNYWLRKGDSLNINELGEGNKLLRSEEMPQTLQLTRSAPETYNLQTNLINAIEQLSGINSTVRGNPPAGIKSGNGMALLVSQSVQFASLIQESYSSLFEEVGTCLLENIQTFGHSERTAQIVGKYNSSMLKTYKPEDIDKVIRVQVDRGNPMSKTVAGRAEIANNLLQQGLITDPRQYIEVLFTGQLDGSIEDTQSLLLSVRAQKEELQEGRWVQPIIIDQHAMCIKEAYSLLSNPSARLDAKLTNMVLKFIQEHLDLWNQMTPALLMMTGQQPPPPPAAPGPQGMPPTGAAGAVPQAGSGATLEAIQPGTSGIADLPSMPSLPPGSPPQAQAAYAQMENQPVS